MFRLDQARKSPGRHFGCKAPSVRSGFPISPALLAMAAAAGLLTPGRGMASDTQGWSTETLTIKLSDRWSTSQDVTTRFSDDRHGLYDVEANTLIGYRLNRSTTLWAGYDHDPQYAGGRFRIMEHRLPQIVSFDNLASIGRGKLTGRVRLEERWRDGLNGTGWRLRPYLRYALPVEEKRKLSLVVSAEPFLDLNRTSFQTVHGLERVRSYAGINAPLTDHLTVDVGYMNQHGFVPHGKDTIDNIAVLSLGLKL